MTDIMPSHHGGVWDDESLMHPPNAVPADASLHCLRR